MSCNWLGNVSGAPIYFQLSLLMYSFLTYFVALVLIAPGAAHCRAQEVASIDVTSLFRKELRRPKVTRITSPKGGIIADYPCSGATQDAGALHTELISVDRPTYRAGDLLSFEVTIKNVGSKSLMIPASADLADVQPEDPSEQFSHSKLTLFLWEALRDKSSFGLAGVQLYGDKSHANTTIGLRPGEWLRIKGRDRINPFPPEMVERIRSGSGTIDYSYPETAVYHCDTLLTTTSITSSCRESCIRQTGGKSFRIAITTPEQ